MKTLEARIRKGIAAIARAKAEGKDTKDWEDHLFSLIAALPKPCPNPVPSEKQAVLVKMGGFGFCTCLLGKGLCCGCWRMVNACSCREIEVDPEEEITRQYARTAGGIH
jgi:hypothetical protein